MLEHVTKSLCLRRQFQTSAWRRFMSSTKKTPQHTDLKSSSPKSDAAVGVVVAGEEAAAGGAHYERALAAGCQPTTAPHDAEWGERFFHLIDPDGHELSFARPLRSSV